MSGWAGRVHSPWRSPKVSRSAGSCRPGHGGDTPITGSRERSGTARRAAVAAEIVQHLRSPDPVQDIGSDCARFAPLESQALCGKSRVKFEERIFYSRTRKFTKLILILFCLVRCVLISMNSKRSRYQFRSRPNQRSGSILIRKKKIKTRSRCRRRKQ